MKELILRYICMVVSVLSQEVTFVIKSIDSSQSTYMETLYVHLMVMKISALAQIVIIVANKNAV